MNFMMLTIIQIHHWFTIFTRNTILAIRIMYMLNILLSMLLFYTWNTTLLKTLYHLTAFLIPFQALFIFVSIEFYRWR